MSLKLITELSHDFELVESKSKGMGIVGIFSSAEIENNNNRKYKKSILEREVTKVNEKAKNGSLWGELGHPPCIFGDNEILTLNGWKRLDSIDNDEVVATLNPKTHEIEYHMIDKKIEEPYKGKMYRYKNRQVDMSFTPTHRHILIDRYNKSLFATSKEIDECETRRFKKCYIPKTGNWIGEDRETFKIPGLNEEKYNSKIYKTDYTKDVFIDMNIFISFLGIYLAEGCMSKGRDGSYTTIHLSQKKEESSLMIKKLLDKFPEELEWSINDTTETNDFYLTDRRLARILEPLGKCYDKFIPNVIKNLSSNYLEQLLYWFGLGDGRHYISEDGFERRDIFSTSEKLIDDFHEIALKCGISARKTKEVCTIDYKIEDRTILTENKQPLYFLKLYTTKGIWMFNNHTEVTKEDYDGYVYCVQVQNENFYIRNKNSVSFWTGNSPEINPDKIAILTKVLEWRDNDLFGQAKILDTPNGNIAKVLIKEGKMGISSRGLGTVADDGYVNEDFNLITWDLVTDPSNNPSWVKGIYEGKDFKEYLPKTKLTIENAKEAHKKQIWQVLKNIEKSI